MTEEAAPASVESRRRGRGASRPKYTTAYMLHTRFNKSGVINCVHQCGSCNNRAPSPDNVRCSCGHTWFTLENLQWCRQCHENIYDCHSCISRIGGWWIREQYFDARTGKYCRDCWVDWFRRQHEQNAVMKVVTVHVKTIADTRDSMAISCCDVGGNEILVKSGVDAGATTLGTLRAELLKICDLPEMRLAKGHFYSFQEFADWYGRDGDRVQGAAQWYRHWDEAPIAKPPLRLISPDGRMLLDEDDSKVLSGLL